MQIHHRNKEGSVHRLGASAQPPSGVLSPGPCARNAYIGRRVESIYRKQAVHPPTPAKALQNPQRGAAFENNELSSLFPMRSSYVASSGGTLTPASRALHQELRESVEGMVFGQPQPQHPTRGSRVGLPTPHHLRSSAGDVIFGGDAWASQPSQRRAEATVLRETAVHAPQQDGCMSSPATSAAAATVAVGGVAHPPSPGMRGKAGGVGGAKLHEIGHRETQPGAQLRCPEHAALQSLTFGAPSPVRPTVGSREHLSRAHIHMSSTADAIIWSK